MTGGGACPCMSPLAARLSIDRTVLRVTTTQRTLAAGPRSQQESGVSPAQRRAIMTMRPPPAGGLGPGSRLFSARDELRAAWLDLTAGNRKPSPTAALPHSL